MKIYITYEGHTYFQTKGFLYKLAFVLGKSFLKNEGLGHFT